MPGKPDHGNRRHGDPSVPRRRGSRRSVDHNSTLHEILQRARQELLDLSARNRLVNTPRDPARGKKLDILNERSEEVFRLLVRERKAMSFLPGQEDDQPGAADGMTAVALSQP